MASIRMWDKIVLLVCQIKHPILNLRILNLFTKISLFIIKIGVLFILYFETLCTGVNQNVRYGTLPFFKSSLRLAIKCCCQVIRSFLLKLKIRCSPKLWLWYNTLMNDYTAKMSLGPDDWTWWRFYNWNNLGTK